MEAVERLGRVMGGTGTVAVLGGDRTRLGWARQRLAELELRWTRFDARSDVSRLNTAAHEWVDVHHDTLVLLATMRQAQRFEGFHPGAGRGLPDGPGGPAGPPFDPELDLLAGRARLGAGCWIDPGSIAKGLAADLVAEGLVQHGCRAAMVELGGDLAVAGQPGGPWTVLVEAFDDPARAVCTFGLDAGGVATSTLHRTSGPLAGTRHVMDRCGGAVSGELAAVTAVAPTGWEAEAAATSALVCGLTDAYRRLPAQGVEAVFQLAGGAVLVTPGLAVTTR